MSDTNNELADLFEDVGNSLQYTGEAWVKVKSYLSVAEVLRGLDEPIDTIVKEGRLESVKGVGKAIAKKITEYLENGTFNLLTRLDQQIPSGARAMIRDGLAPSVVHALEAQGIDTLDGLSHAIDHGEVDTAKFKTPIRKRFEEYITKGSHES